MLYFGKIPKKFGEVPREHLTRFSKKFSKKFSKILAKFAKFFKNQQNFQQFLTKKLRLENGAMVFLVFWDSIPKRCKGVHCVDLGESFPTSIYLQNLASIQPRTSLFNFFNSNPPLVI